MTEQWYKKHVSENLQLAKTIEMKDIKFPAIAELKLDGIRVLFLNGKFYSRSGKRIYLPETENALSYLDNLMLDIEVTLETPKQKYRQIISGIINSAIHKGSINEDLLFFNIIDMMNGEHYIKKHCVKTLKERKQRIKEFIHLNDNGISFRQIETFPINNLEECQEAYNDAITLGYEGIIVKHEEDKYQFKRSSQWARFKEVRTTDLKCIGVFEGQGKYEGLIGGLHCRGIAEGEEVEVKVGSGMTDYDRERSPEYYIGKIIEVKYNSLSYNKVDNRKSLFLPRFVCVRHDKS